ncbi:Transcriptional regulator PadR-like family protein [Raineyella antarctica]|uniref:Transcriptional regulator PadR-like family protein n=1 Tax=Raineyella antarctica TaxID=1577474 RepID=A0A1G6GHA1_9ACTN|nr:PadR family transcriptional regulator [Raineyella antarctica]SDB81269.1 Transcriptional regulator PadR-like family protein [Raineyella antarctica]
MSLKHAVLGVLEATPMTGYDLKRFFDASMGWLWSAKHSQIYPLLATLESEGLVDAEEGIRGEAQRRVVYRLTAAGRAELESWIATVHPLPGERDPFLLQAVFFDMIDDDQVRTVLVAYRDEQFELYRDAEAHSLALAAGETPLIRERLRVRPEQADRIRAMKARAFRARADVAKVRWQWAEDYLADLG